MIVRQRFDGGAHPFEGERRLILGEVPAGAKVLHARAVVSPARNADGEPPVETLAFAGQAWGATRVRRPAGPAGEPGWVEVDFHTRRTLHSVAGSGLDGGTVQIDLGGAFAEVKHNGTLLAPSDPAGDALTLAGDDDVLPGLTVGRFRISHDTASPDLFRVRVRGVPRNVSLALGAGPAFFTAPGELTRAATVEDFTTILAAFLGEDEPENGFHRVPLILRSDALGRLDVEVEIELLQQRSLLPPGLDEITVPYAYGAAPVGDHGRLEVALPPGMRVRATEGRVVGAFEESRVVLGPTGEVPATPPSVPLAADRAQAQRLVLAERLEVSAVDLLLAAVSRRARLELDLLEDLDGRPGGGSLLPRPAAFTLERETAGEPTWVSVPLGAEVQLEDHDPDRAWLAVKVLEGDALWFAAEAGAEEPEGLRNTTDGGLSWRRSEADGVAAPAGLFRLRRVPETFRMPVELQVGAGEATRRVRFSGQEARGRVELDLGLPEVAEALDAVLAADGSTRPEGAGLDNPDFERWFAMGDALGAADVTSLDVGFATASLVAASPDGRKAFIVTGVDDERATFQAVDVVCRQVGDPIRLSAEPAVGLAVDPAGRRAYVALSRSLHVLDLEGPRLLASVPTPGRILSALALSPDGERLFLASTRTGTPARVLAPAVSGPTIEPIAAAALEPAVLAGAGGLPGGAPGDPVAILDAPALALAVSADGSRLVSLSDSDPAAGSGRRLQAFDALSLGRVGEPVPVAAGTAALAAGGGRLASVGPGGPLALFDSSTLRLLGEVPVPPGTDRVALEPGGRRAFLAAGGEVIVVDLERRRQVQRLDLSGDPADPLGLSDLAVTSDGSHLLLAGRREELLSGAFGLVPLGTHLPAEWAVTGPVRRACLDGSGAVLVLGSDPGAKTAPDGPFGLSQVAAATPGRYELTFDGAATVEDARLEVSWIADGCRPTETVAVPVPRISGDVRLLPRTSRSLTAPSGTRQVEVRLRLPEGAAGVSRIALAATADVLENGLLRPSPEGLPAGWEVSPAGAAGFAVTAAPGGGVRLVSGAGTVALVQTVDVEPGRLFDLTVDAGPGGAGTPDPATLIVRWLSASGDPAGAPVELTLGGAGAVPPRAGGTVPDGAAAARLELQVPAGASLALSRVGFALRTPRRAPVVFLAQAPGELRIRDWRVAYEPGEPARPAPPATGLCAPTPPGAEAGEEACDEAVCPHCGKETATRSGGALVTEAGRAVTVEACARCDAPRLRFGGRPAPGAERFAPRTLPPARPSASPAPAALAPAADRSFPPSGWAGAADPRREIPLTDIVGIGKKRAAELEALGLDSVRKLARADAGALDGKLGGAARPLVEDLIAQARRLTR